MVRMGSINEYIFRTTLGAFLIVLVSLTAVIWVTQALRDIDIMGHADDRTDRASDHSSQ